MKKIVKNENDYLEYAKERISLARQYLYADEADFSDMRCVPIIQDLQFGEIVTLSINVDLEEKTFHYYANNIEYLEEKYESIKTMVEEKLYDPIGNLRYNLAVDRNLPSFCLMNIFKHFGYEILKPKNDTNDKKIHIRNYEKKCKGSIPYRFEIPGYSPNNCYNLPKAFNRHSMVDGDILLIHGAGKIYTFQFKNDKLIFIDNFFKETLDHCLGTDSRSSIFIGIPKQ